MRRRDLLTGTASLGLLVSAAHAAIVTPPAPVGRAGRDALHNVVNGVAVTDSAYGAVDDGLQGYFVATWTTAATGVVAFASNVSVTVANTGANGGARVTIPGATTSNGAAPHQRWVGQPIAIAGAGSSGGIFTSIITSFYLNTSFSPPVATVECADAAPTPITASVQQLSCPCFSQSDVGKKIWLSVAGSTGGTSGPFGAAGNQSPFSTTIASVTDAFTIVLGATIPGITRSAKGGTLIAWGTDNTPAIVAAGTAALAQGHRSLFFPGRGTPQSTGLFCAFDFIQGASVVPTTQEYLNSVTLAALIWYGSNADLFLVAETGTRGAQQNPTRAWDTTLKKALIPWQAPSPPPLPRGLKALTQSPRANTQSTIVLVTVGDSYAAPQPSGTGDATIDTFIVAEVQRQNPGKRIIHVNRGIGGATWQKLIDTANLSTNPQLPWATGSAAWLDLALSVPAGALGTVVPDVVCNIMTCTNDQAAISTSHIEGFINKVRTATAANGYPPDVWLFTGTTKDIEGFTAGNGDFSFLEAEYGTQMVRGFARSRGYGVLDMATQGAWATEGWAPDRMTLKNVPSIASGTATNLAPYVSEYRTRNFFIAYQITGVASTAWAAAGGFSFTISPRPDERLVVAPDGSNNLTVRHISWGSTIPVTASITNGVAVLTTSGQTAFTATNAMSRPTVPEYQVGSATQFSAGMLGQCYLQGGINYGGGDFRSYVTGYVNTSIAYVSDAGFQNSVGTVGFWGGHMFIPSDALANADVVLNDGTTTLTTQVIGYTSKTQVTLAANWTGTTRAAFAFPSMFLGRQSAAVYDTPVSIATDTTNGGAILAVSVQGTHVRVIYVPGSVVNSSTDIKAALQNLGAIIVWEGEIDRCGGPFVPKVFTTGAGPVTLAAAYVWIEDRIITKPTLTYREAYGASEATYSATEYGGDDNHPSTQFMNQIVRPMAEAQDFSTDTKYANDFTTVIATTAGYTIPANQAFTNLTPAGTLATCPTTLPAAFPQGGRLEVFTSQIITSWIVSAATGFTIAGTAVTAGTANQTIAYRLAGTVWTRVQ